MELDVDIEESWPPGPWEELSNRSGAALAEVAPELAGPRLSAGILFTSDDEVRALNRLWRERDKPTNVLSFPMIERADLLELPSEGPPRPAWRCCAGV